METSQRQTLLFGTDASTSLLVDFRANRTPKPESDLERRMSAIYGRKCLEQYGKLNHVGSWAKMFPALLLGMEGWFSRMSVWTWKMKATKYKRTLFHLQQLGLDIDGKGLGLLPTPTASDCIGGVLNHGRYHLENGRIVRTSIKTGVEFNAKLNTVGRILQQQDQYLLKVDFYSQMMGYPDGWTELPFLSGDKNPSRHTETP